MGNLHKLYYKDYFKDVNFSDLKSKASINSIEGKNSALLSAGLSSVIPSNSEVGDNHFKMKIEYPGLITGIGINHEATIEGEFKLGMHFDYTRGMPVIYGSSVKGVLASYFMEFCEQENAAELFNRIFKGLDADGNPISIYDRDVFFDAVVVAVGRDGLLQKDSLAPHKDNPLKNPIPITFMKIAAGCTIEFRFRLQDSPEFDAKQKLKLFKEILATVGIGAKTNVGYGQLTPVN